MTDLLSRLTAARPDDDDLARMWPDEQRTATLGRIEDRARVRRTHPVRRMALLAAAAAVAAVLVVPPILDSGDATAADLHALAVSAVKYDGPVLAEGTWLHERSTSLQTNSRILSDGDVYDNERETWTSWDGRSYLVEHRPSAGWTSYDLIDNVADGVALEPSVSFPTPEFAASLPSTAAGLRAYLDPQVSGSSSHDEALFEALRGLATSHTLPPVTLAATFEALAGVDGVRTEDVRVEGRPAVSITHTEHYVSALGTDSLVADRATGQVLSMRQASPLSEYESTTVLSEVVDRVPDRVLADFATYGDGGVICDNGETSYDRC